MPITSKKQSQAKQNWMNKNSKIYSIRVMKNTEKDLFDYLENNEEPAATIFKKALREHIKSENK